MYRIILPALFLLFSAAGTGLAAPTLLFDQGHGQAFTIEKQGALQLGRFADQFRSDGWQVRSTAGEITPKSLAGVDALIISGPFKPFSQKETEAVIDFLGGGGRVSVMLHVAPPAAPLLSRLGVVTANGVVREGNKNLVLGDDPLNFKVADLKPHVLNRGLDFFSLYGGWPLLPEGQHTVSIADTSRVAWVDLDNDKVMSFKDARQKLSVAVTGTIGKGAFVVFADDAIFQNLFLRAENVKLAENLSRWLMAGAGQGGTEI